MKCVYWRSFAVAFLLGILGVAGRAVACELPPPKDPAKSWVVYRLDEARSRVRFDAKAFMHEVAGKTSKLQGTIRLGDRDRFTDAEACVRIDAASLDTDNSTRDGIMRQDHLETTRFPTIDFTLKQVEAVRRQGDGWEFGARGTLSLHGVSREILLPVRARPVDGGMRLTANVPIKMTDYRIPIPRFLLLTLEDQVVVSFDVVAKGGP